MNVKLSTEEIAKRLEELKPFEKKVKKGWLGRYTQHVLSANYGACMDNVIETLRNR